MGSFCVCRRPDQWNCVDKLENRMALCIKSSPEGALTRRLLRECDVAALLGFFLRWSGHIIKIIIIKPC